ncbi:MAG: hypothetical protein WD981_03195 [Gaiellaceae bacterium]
MKRIFLIRRRRYLARAISLGFAVAVLLPTAALARYDERGTGAVVDIYATSGLTAEDVHGLSAGSGYVLPAADRKAVEQAARGGTVGPDRYVPQNVTTPSVAPASTIEWGRIALFSSLGLFGIVGLLMLAALASRRGVRVAHS